jgi:hypothetical protein
MMNDNDSIARRVDIELYRVRAKLECLEKGRNRVFRNSIVGAAVRDALRSALGQWGQSGLRVVAFAR